MSPSALLRPERLALDVALTPKGLLRDFHTLPWKTVRGYDDLWTTVTGTFPEAARDMGNPADRNLSARRLSRSHTTSASAWHMPPTVSPSRSGPGSTRFVVVTRGRG